MMSNVDMRDLSLSDSSIDDPSTDNSGRSYGGMGADERRAQRRAQLIDAGTRAFGRDGFKGTTTRSLCAEAKLTQRYFYESFRDMEDLFVAVYRSHVKRIFTSVDKARTMAPLGSAQLVQMALQAFFLELKNDPYGARIFLSEVFTVNRETESMARETIDGFAQLLRTAIFPTGAEPPLPGIDYHLLSIGLVGSGHHIAWTWMLNNFEESVDSVVETAMALYWLTVSKQPDESKKAMTAMSRKETKQRGK